MMSIDPSLDLGIRAALVGLFGLAVAHKLTGVREFRATLRAYLRGTFLDRSIVVRLLAGAVIGFELTTVILVAAPLTSSLGGACAAWALLLYAGAIALNLLRGNDLLDCGCSWGTERQPARYGLIWRNIVLAGLASLLTLPRSNPIASMDQLVAALSIGAMILVFYLIFNQLLANRGKLELEP